MRRLDSVNTGEFPGQRFGQGRLRACPGNPVAERRAGNPLHQIERLACNTGIAAMPERSWHPHAGGFGGFQEGELLVERPAFGNRRHRLGPQNQIVPAVRSAATDRDCECAVLLNGAAGQ